MRSWLLRVLTAVALLSGLSGCLHSAGDLCYLRPGSSRQEVVQYLGQPAAASASKNVTVFRYELLTAQPNSSSSGNAAAQVESYYIRLVDDAVDSFGKWKDLPEDKPEK